MSAKNLIIEGCLSEMSNSLILRAFGPTFCHVLFDIPIRKTEETNIYFKVFNSSASRKWREPGAF